MKKFLPIPLWTIAIVACYSGDRLDQLGGWHGCMMLCVWTSLVFFVMATCVTAGLLIGVFDGK